MKYFISFVFVYYQRIVVIKGDCDRFGNYLVFRRKGNWERSFGIFEFRYLVIFYNLENRMFDVSGLRKCLEKQNRKLDVKYYNKIIWLQNYMIQNYDMCLLFWVCFIISLILVCVLIQNIFFKWFFCGFQVQFDFYFCGVQFFILKGVCFFKNDILFGDVFLV